MDGSFLPFSQRLLGDISCNCLSHLAWGKGWLGHMQYLLPQSPCVLHPEGISAFPVPLGFSSSSALTNNFWPSPVLTCILGDTFHFGPTSQIVTPPLCSVSSDTVPPSSSASPLSSPLPLLESSLQFSSSSSNKRPCYFLFLAGMLWPFFPFHFLYVVLGSSVRGWACPLKQGSLLRAQIPQIFAICLIFLKWITGIIFTALSAWWHMVLTLLPPRESFEDKIYHSVSVWGF